MRNSPPEFSVPARAPGKRGPRGLHASLVFLAWAACADAGEPPPAPTLEEIEVVSTADQTRQPVRLWIPESAHSAPRPLLVFLHSWSGDYRQDNSAWLKEAAARGWIYLHPNFRGRNDHPDACGSPRARQDILDAVDDVSRRACVDSERIYLAGTSGGGHMALLMAGRHPQRFSAVSAWVPIADLARWHRFHSRDGKLDPYARMIEASLGGPPGASDAVDAAYRDRSPIFHLERAGELPIDINAGVTDGKTGSVPISHSLSAFNAVARGLKAAEIPADEFRELCTHGRLSHPSANDVAEDPTYGRAIILRRTAGASRVTIFDGGHEGLPKPAVEWLSRQKRRTSSE